MITYLNFEYVNNKFNNNNKVICLNANRIELYDKYVTMKYFKNLNKFLINLHNICKSNSSIKVHV
jgi:GTPase SAR1 family protein